MHCLMSEDVEVPGLLHCGYFGIGVGIYVYIYRCTWNQRDRYQQAAVQAALFLRPGIVGRRYLCYTVCLEGES